ncbi:MAG: hypothetical protein LUI04_01325, partial [Porphyromonadaceae bacterium]|nr:hypothetical protein [Porphyromonadaceae bacterium]
VWDKPLLKKTFSIVGYNGLGTAVFVLNDQGINILLNIFFGPVVNAARAVSFQISNALSNFTNNFYTAVRPQMTKSYAKGDKEYLMSLFYKSSKFAFFLFWALCVPIALCIDQILALWLKQVPTYTNIFTIWIFGYALINVLNNPIWTIALAVGKLRNYMLIGSAVFLMVFPLSYISLKLGHSPVSVFVILFGVRLCYLFVVLRILKGYIDYRIRDYLKKVIFPILQVAVLSLLINFVLRSVIPDTLALMFVFILLSLVVTGACVWGLGLSAEERHSLLSLVKQKMVRL